MTALRERMLHDMRIRNLSSKTQHGYLRAVEGLARHYGKSPNRIGQREVEEYIAHLFQERKYAPGSLRGTVTGLRFFYLTTLTGRGLYRPSAAGATSSAPWRQG